MRADLRGSALEQWEDTLHLAGINIARLKYPIDDSRIGEFARDLDLTTGIAERSEGFGWRVKLEKWQRDRHPGVWRSYDHPQHDRVARCRRPGAPHLEHGAQALLKPTREVAFRHEDGAFRHVVGGRRAPAGSKRGQRPTGSAQRTRQQRPCVRLVAPAASEALAARPLRVSSRGK